MRANSGEKGKIVSEINVTPLVDVMLVLLVIFMITAPLMFNALSLDLPKTKEVNPVQLTSHQVVLSFSKNKEFYIGKKRVLHNDLTFSLKSEMEKLKTDVLFLRADYSLSYGDVARLMSTLKHGGIQKISLITETETRSLKK